MNKTWPGSVITGVNGSVFIFHNAEKIDQLEVNRVKSKLGRDFVNYQPWMSSLSDLERMSLLNDLEVENDFFLTKKSTLFLSNVLSEGSITGSLKFIHEDLKNMFCIYKEGDDGYEINLNFLKESFETLKEVDSTYYIRVQKIVSQVILQKGLGDKKLREGGTGVSSFNYRKGIFLSVPTCEYSQFELLLNIAHELGHQSLINLQKVDKIIMDSHFSPIYSVIRRTNRPSILSFHALTASIFMLEFILRNYVFLKSLCSEDYFFERLENIKNDVQKGISNFSKVNFSPLGKQIINEYIALSLESLKNEI